MAPAIISGSTDTWSPISRASQMLRPRHPSRSIAATSAGALRWIWLWVSMRSKDAGAARPDGAAAAAGSSARISRLVIRMSEVELHGKLDDARLVSVAAADIGLVDRAESGAGEGGVRL